MPIKFKTEEETASVFFRSIPKKVLREFKATCAVQCLSMQSVITELMRRHIKEVRKSFKYPKE